jgi:tartrate-resistant acid phosphatase type 5
MFNRTLALLLAGLILLSFNATLAQGRSAQELSTQSSPPALAPPSEALLKRISPDLRDKAIELLRFPPSYDKHLLSLPDEELRAQIAYRLAHEPEATEFVIDLIKREPSAKVRLGIIWAWRYPHWVSNPRMRQLAADLVTSDPSPTVVLTALETIRRTEMQAARQLLKKRIETARQQGNQDLFNALATEDERWISLERGTMLPSFLRKVPPLFAAMPAGERVRVLAFGDFGIANEAQEKVAAAALMFHRKAPFDFGLTVGDNFYGVGMESTSDPRWETRWEKLYKPLGIKFYATLGNHDWGLADSPAAEILYSSKSETWRMPAPYYTYTAGPVQFFALDTNEVSEAQMLWLTEQLAKSKARWKIVYGHFPVYVSNIWGPQYTEAMQKVLPILKNRADLYLCGHHHSMQHLKPDGGVHFVVSGGGGRTTYPVNPKDDRALFAQSINGFTVLEANERELVFKHVGTDGKELYSYTLRK